MPPPKMRRRSATKFASSAAIAPALPAPGLFACRYAAATCSPASEYCAPRLYWRLFEKPVLLLKL
jgi:hypothetical protein